MPVEVAKQNNKTSYRMQKVSVLRGIERETAMQYVTRRLCATKATYLIAGLFNRALGSP